jgi:hypothetical protein
MHDEDLIEEPTTRAGFVKRLGKMAAIGLGIALVPATSAQAILFKCCRSSFCDSQCAGCHPPCGLFGYQCPSNPCASCCTCFNSNIGSCTQNMSQCPC